MCEIDHNLLIIEQADKLLKDWSNLYNDTLNEYSKLSDQLNEHYRNDE